MNIGIIGKGAHAAARRQAAEALPEVAQCVVLDDVVAPMALAADAAAALPLDDMLDTLDAVFITGPTAAHFHLAEAATKQGIHVFLDWPPATSYREGEAIVGLSEEAGVEVGVSRPLRFHPVFDELPEPGRAALILLRRAIPAAEEAAWPHWLADAVDLCCALAQSHGVQRVDAEAVRGATPWPHAVAVGLRFHSGTYAQISIRHGGGAAEGVLYATGAGLEVEVPLYDAVHAEDAPAHMPPTRLIAAETQAFLLALAAGRPAPVSILDGLHTMRLVERLMQKLR